MNPPVQSSTQTPANTPGLLLVISGPSGVGKTTITHEVERRLGGVFSVSVTTRPKTAADVEGRDYHFIDDAEFTRLRDGGELLESATVFGRHSYGTPLKPVLEHLALGHLVILEIDVQGALQVKSKMPDAFMFFVLPPSDDELLRRLRARGRDSDDAIQRRFHEARREIDTARASNQYDAFIVNDDLKHAIEQACEIGRQTPRGWSVRGDFGFWILDFGLGRHAPRRASISHAQSKIQNPKSKIATLVAAIILLSNTAFADSVKGIRPATNEPIGPRGGIMMVPLLAERPGDDWPRTLDVRMADGTRLQADVAWIFPAPARLLRRWTDDPRRLAIRGIDRDDDSSRLANFAAGLGPYMLLRVPDHADGTLRVENVTLTPRWCDVPWNDPLREPDAPLPSAVLPLAESPDRPDPDSPFEYWRWVLLADRLGMAPPAPVGDDMQRTAAEHYAALWRIGLARLAAVSTRIAAECRERLTHTALDRGRPAAAWVADAQQAAALLNLLLDFSRDDNAALTGAVGWLDQQTPIMLWPESESGDVVRLAIGALRPESLPVRFSWVGANPATQPPSALELEGGVIAHVSVDRLPMDTRRIAGVPQTTEPTTQILRVTTDAGGGRSFDITCGPRVVVAQPPGVYFATLTPPLTLADVQFNLSRPVDPDRATQAQVRRLGGRWEVFIECRRIAEQQQRVDPSAIRSFEDLRGIEAITVLLGPDEDAVGAGGAGAGGRGAGPSIWLTIPEHDWPVLARGLGHPDLQVHKRSFADRWTCRIVLPDQWFSAGETNPAYIGFIRSHADNQQVETGPAPSPPWRIAPGRTALDLDHWDDLPTADGP